MFILHRFARYITLDRTLFKPETWTALRVDHGPSAPATVTFIFPLQQCSCTNSFWRSS